MKLHLNITIYQSGIYVKSVEKDSSAAAAGIKKGDVITGISGNPIKTMNDLNTIKKTRKVGDTLSLNITRDKKNTVIDVTLKDKP